MHELLQAGEAPELPSRVVTLRRERVAIIAGLFALYNGALGLVTMALFGFDAEIADAERADLSSARVRVRLAERDDGERKAEYAERLRATRKGMSERRRRSTVHPDRRSGRVV